MFMETSVVGVDCGFDIECFDSESQKRWDLPASLTANIAATYTKIARTVLQAPVEVKRVGGELS
jgi:hypothetical protein